MLKGSIERGNLKVHLHLAQDRPKFEISAGYSYHCPKTSVGPFNLNGGIISVTFHPKGILRVLNLVLLFASFLIPGTLLFAQDRPKYELSAGYSYQRANTSVGPFNLNGVDISMARSMNSWLGIAVDLSGYHTEGFREAIYQFGPHVRRPISDKMTVFGEALFGGAHVNAGARGLPSYTNGLAVAVGGGLDYHLGGKFSIRAAQIDYQQTRLGGGVQHNVRVAVGIVYQFGAI